MKQIAVKKIKKPLYKSEVIDSGFVLSYDDDEENAAAFDLCHFENSKLLEKKVIIEFWEKLQEVNFQKVLLENEPFQSFNKTWSVVELSVGSQTLSLKLWKPSFAIYKRNNLLESYKLLGIVRDIVDFAAENNISNGLKF